MPFIEIVLLAGLLSFFYAYLVERHKKSVLEDHLTNLVEILADVADKKAVCTRTPEGHVNVEKVS
jgi:CRISPR/Cas system CSM-associated protein Csm2 small subunit